MIKLTREGKILLLLVVLVFSQLIANVPKLTERGMWSDELFTAAVIRYHPIFSLSFERKVLTNIDLPDSFLTVKAGEQHPPLYDLLVKAWAFCFGDSAFSLRLFSVVCLILSSTVFVRLAYTEKQDQALYLSLALMLAVLPIMQAYALQSRSYMFCVLLSSLILFTVIKCKNSDKHFRLLYILIAASFITHYYFALFTGALYLIAICYEIKITRRITRFALVPILVILIWGWLSYHSILFTATGGVSWKTITLHQSFTNILESIYSYFGPFIFLGPLAFLVSVFRRQQFLVLGFVVFSVTVLALSIACSKAGIQHPRHFLFFVPWILYLVLAPLFSLMSERMKVPVVILLSLTAYSAPKPQLVYANEGYDAASRFIVENWGVQKRIYASWQANEAYYKYYLDDYSTDKRHLTMLSSNHDVESACVSIANENSPLFAHTSHKEIIVEYLKCLPKDSKKVTKRFGDVVVVYSGH